MNINITKFSKEDIIKTLNDGKYWDCTLVPRFLYEVFDKDEIKYFKGLITSGTFEQTKEEFTYGRIWHFSEYSNIPSLISRYIDFIKNPSECVLFGGYMSETLSDPIEMMFYMRKQITCGDHICMLHCRCTFEFEVINDKQVIIVFKVHDVF